MRRLRDLRAYVKAGHKNAFCIAKNIKLSIIEKIKKMNTTVQQLLTALELHEAGNWENVQKHVRKLLLRYHPDVHAENKLYYEEKTKKILHAYALLREYVSAGNSLPLMPEPEPVSISFPLSFLVFSIVNKSFAFPVENVKEVVKTDHLENHGLYLGKLCVRSEEIPIFSLSAFLSLPQVQTPLFDTLPSRSCRIIVLKQDTKKAGFLVEHIEGVTEFHEKDFVMPAFHSTHKKYLYGVAVKDTTYVTILSPEEIFASLQ